MEINGYKPKINTLNIVLLMLLIEFYKRKYVGNFTQLYQVWRKEAEG